MKRLLFTLIAWATGVPFASPRGRLMTHDVAFKFRMGAGFPGDVNRTHPASVEPALVGSVPPTAYGIPVIPDAANGVRMFQAGDTAVVMPWGIAVRPFPTQQASGGMTASLGSATPPTTGVIDVLRSGYVLVQLNDIAALPKKGDPVFVWCAVTSGIHIQGGIEVVASGGNTAALDITQYYFNGPPDAAGVVEITVNA